MPMRCLAARLSFAAIALSLLSSRGAIARDLTFQERVAAQRAIERFYYSHQIGTTAPFEEVVSDTVLENKVRTYLKQSVALEQFWRTPVTAEMLRAEMERIITDTRMPEGLQELYAALGNDRFLVAECVARATLVRRLVHNFFPKDERVHGPARREAEQLRGRLLSGELSIAADDPRRSVVEISSTHQDRPLAREPATQ